MAVYSKDPTGSVFYIFFSFGSYTVYDSTFGNVVKSSHGQVMYQRSIVILNAFVSEQLGRNKRTKFFLMIPNGVTGFIELKFKHHLYSDKNASVTLEKEPSGIRPSQYELLLKIPSIFYCIETLGNEYYLYDFDMGNPLSGEVDIGSNQMMKTSKKSSDTKDLIDTLPRGAIVYSLKVDAKAGFVTGDAEFEVFPESLSPSSRLEELSQQKSKNLSGWNVSKKSLLERKKTELMAKRGKGILL